MEPIFSKTELGEGQISMSKTPSRIRKRIYITVTSNATQTRNDFIDQLALFSSNREVGDLLEVSYWCGRADLMKAIGGEAVKGCPELL
jgi:hypothetical protein